VSAVTAMPVAARRDRPAARQVFGHPDVLAVTTLAVAVGVFSVIADGFASVVNVRSIVIAAAVFACMALGENLVILAGEIDVSVGSTLALAGFAAGHAANSTHSLLLTLLVGLGVGVAGGLVNGVIVAFTRVPSIVVTLGTLYVYQGFALLISHSRNITSIPAPTAAFGSGSVLGVPRPALVVFVAFVVLGAVRRNTRWGRDLLACGGNRQAAKTMGVPVKAQLIVVFAVAGLLAGLAAVVYLGQLGGMQTSVTQTNTVLQVIAACAIGGTAITGGRGTDLAPVTGALLIGVITAGLVIMGVPSVWLSCAYGGCILLAVARDRFEIGRGGSGHA
jgi:ribose/xylose/arabinose/galactoside ABC-type transport system permease subunit